MPSAPTRRDRWLALGLLLAVLALVYLLLVHPLFTVPWRAMDQEIVGLQERQQRVQVQLDQRPQVAERLQQVQEALRQRPGFLTEATAEGAAAALSARVQEVVASASPGNRACVVSNRTPMPDSRGDATYTRVAMQVRLRCGVDEMATVLQSLETGTPRLFVENLNMLAQRFQQSPVESGTGLDVSFELVGYLQPAGLASAQTAPTAGTAMPTDSGPSASAAPASDLEAGPADAGRPEAAAPPVDDVVDVVEAPDAD